ncbi:cytochrome c oxidase subunit 2 [Candidatus Kryptobacter tengchongensis]|nr:cytochrome c oxidase subunit 2 [Candidatus Kryptobacter tengchongensis]
MAVINLIAVLIFIIFSIVIFGVYAYFFNSTRRPAEGADYYKVVAKLRVPFFFLILLLLIAGLVLTLTKVPYPSSGQFPDAVVYVVGKQFSFAFDTQPIETEERWKERTEAEPVQVPSDKWIEFRVTSLDVNHGFSLYDENGKLLGQTQAMPGYVNRLFIKFDQPGFYTAYCMELCGNSHHAMKGIIEVVETRSFSSKIPN